MLNAETLKNYWNKLESQSQPPKVVKKISIIEFHKIKNSINNKNEFFVKNLAKRMYSGEAFIVRNAAKKNLRKTIIDLAKYYDKKQKPSFFNTPQKLQISREQSYTFSTTQRGYPCNAFFPKEN